MYRPITFAHLAIASLVMAQPPVTITGREIGCAGQECATVERGLQGISGPTG